VTLKGTARPKTLNRRLSLLSMLLQKACDWKRIDKMPCRIALPDVDDDAEAGFYDHETYERIVAASADLEIRRSDGAAGSGSVTSGTRPGPSAGEEVTQGVTVRRRDLIRCARARVSARGGAWR
jgi:hypothetical protein